MTRARKQILRAVFLFVVPAILLLSCGLNLALLARGTPPSPTTVDIEATVQARVDAILSDLPPAQADVPAVPAPTTALDSVVRSGEGFLAQLFAAFGLAGLGESIAGLVDGVWNAISGLGIIAQILCCCALPVVALVGVGLVSQFLGD